MDETKQKKDYLIFFLTGCLMGALCFVGVYGVKILDVTYDAWLLNGDLDLMQHYIGWGHYRYSPWSFPIGLISSLSVPYRMSVVYTDSVPLVAVICKCLSPLLPETFQYFGIYGCFSFALQGGCAMILLRRFIRHRWIVAVSAVFFILSFPILQRMYYHTALASQWLILLAFIIWFYEKEDAPLLKQTVKWALMGFLCVSIHSYFLPMCGAILLFSVEEQIIVSKKKKEKLSKAFGWGAVKIAGFCVAGILNLWILGAFYGGASAIGGGIGTFESNLNTFYNPLGEGITGISLPLYYDFQYEGFAYLGMGMLLIVLLLIVGAIGLLVLGQEERAWKKYLKEHHRQVLLLLLFVLFVLLAAGPIYSWNDHKLFAIPLPGIIGTVADIFRSNGRMIWVAYYTLMLVAFTAVDRLMRKSSQIIILVLALLLQITDLSAVFADKQAYFNRVQTYSSEWEDPKLQQIMGAKSEFILMEDSTMMMMDAAYYAMKHHMSTNRFYYARNIDAKIDEQMGKYELELRDGSARESAVYVFAKDGFVGAAYPGLVCYEIGEHVIGVKQD